VVKVAVYHLGEKAISSGGHAAGCAGAIQRKEGGIQVLAGLARANIAVKANVGRLHEHKY